MVDATQIRTQILTKIFTPHGKSVTHRTRNAPTYNTRGEIVTDSWTSATISIVPYDITQDRLSFESFGDHVQGELYAAVPYTITINVTDQIVLEGDTYEIKEVVPHYLPDNLVTVVKMAKVVA